MVGAVAIELGRMLQSGAGVGAGGAGLLVAVVMESTQALTPVLEAHHQILLLQPEAAPVLNHPQAFPGTVEVGVDQACHPWIQGCLAWGWIHGTLWATVSASVMENGGSESTMHVLVWGIVLLGGIGVFIVWGLVNAYPTVA